MCGIFGVLSPYLKGNHQSLHEHKEKVNCALNLLAHRGPDGAGIWSSAEHGSEGGYSIATRGRGQWWS